MRLQRDQRVLHLKGVVDVPGTFLLFTARKPGIRPVDQHIVNRAAIKAVVFYAVVTGVTDIRVAEQPVGVVVFEGDTVAGMNDGHVFNRGVGGTVEEQTGRVMKGVPIGVVT